MARNNPTKSANGPVPDPSPEEVDKMHDKLWLQLLWILSQAEEGAVIFPPSSRRPVRWTDLPSGYKFPREGLPPPPPLGKTELSFGSAAPRHFSLTFAVGESLDLTLNLRADNTDALLVPGEKAHAQRYMMDINTAAMLGMIDAVMHQEEALAELGSLMKGWAGQVNVYRTVPVNGKCDILIAFERSLAGIKKWIRERGEGARIQRLRAKVETACSLKKGIIQMSAVLDCDEPLGYELCFGTWFEPITDQPPWHDSRGRGVR